MIIIFIHRGLRADKELQEIVCEKIERLPNLLHIEVAEFTLERSGPGGSLFTARIHLATAVKDYCAESRGRTKIGAIDQMLAKLASQFQQSSRNSSPGTSILRAAKVKASSRNQSLQITAN